MSIQGQLYNVAQTNRLLESWSDICGQLQYLSLSVEQVNKSFLILIEFCRDVYISFLTNFISPVFSNSSILQLKLQIQGYQIYFSIYNTMYFHASSVLLSPYILHFSQFLSFLLSLGSDRCLQRTLALLNDCSDIASYSPIFMFIMYQTSTSFISPHCLRRSSPYENLSILPILNPSSFTLCFTYNQYLVSRFQIHYIFQVLFNLYFWYSSMLNSSALICIDVFFFFLNFRYL